MLNCYFTLSVVFHPHAKRLVTKTVRINLLNVKAQYIDCTATAMRELHLYSRIHSSPNGNIVQIVFAYKFYSINKYVNNRYRNIYIIYLIFICVLTLTRWVMDYENSEQFIFIFNDQNIIPNNWRMNLVFYEMNLIRFQWNRHDDWNGNARIQSQGRVGVCSSISNGKRKSEAQSTDFFISVLLQAQRFVWIIITIWVFISYAQLLMISW